MKAAAMRIGFIAAAALPGVALLGLSAAYARDAYLIRTHQIVVAQRPVHGQSSTPEVPASTALMLALACAAFAAVFGYAIARRSSRALVAGWFVLVVLAVLPRILRAL